MFIVHSNWSASFASPAATRTRAAPFGAAERRAATSRRAARSTRARRPPRAWGERAAPLDRHAQLRQGRDSSGARDTSSSEPAGPSAGGPIVHLLEAHGRVNRVARCPHPCQAAPRRRKPMRAANATAKVSARGPPRSAGTGPREDASRARTCGRRSPERLRLGRRGRQQPASDSCPRRHHNKTARRRKALHSMTAARSGAGSAVSRRTRFALTGVEALDVEGDQYAARPRQDEASRPAVGRIDGTP